MTAANELVARGRMKAPALKTRKPDPKPVWPMVLAAAVKGAGKSYSAMEAANSPLIGHTFAMEIGEASLDPYSRMVDLDHFDMLVHEGTYADIASQVWAAVEQPRVDPAKPNLLIFDGATGLWDLLVNENQIIANARAKRWNKPIGPDGADISPDLWNAAKKKWQAVIALFQAHDGPVIITGRLGEVAVFDGKAPAKDGAKEWKVDAHKSLPFDVDIMLEAREVRMWEATKTRSLDFTIEPGTARKLPGFTFDKLWRDLGLVEGAATGKRQITAQNAAAGAEETTAREGGGMTGNQWLAAIAEATEKGQLLAFHARAKAAEQLDLVIDGQILDARLRSRAEELGRQSSDDDAAVRAAAQQAQGGQQRSGEAAAQAGGTRLAEPAPEQSAEDKAAEEERKAAAAEADAEQRGMLIDELKMLARVCKVAPTKLTHRVLPKGPHEATTADLQKATAGLRVIGVSKLKELGRTAEAASYQQVGAGDYAPPAHLLGSEDLSWLPEPVA